MKQVQYFLFLAALFCGIQAQAQLSIGAGLGYCTAFENIGVMPKVNYAINEK